MKKLTLFLGLVMVLLGGGCKTEKEKPSDVLLPHIIRDYFGSYDSTSTWIFTKQNNPTFTDTIAVTDFKTMSKSYDIGADGYCEKTGCRKEETEVSYYWRGKKVPWLNITLHGKSFLIGNAGDFNMLTLLKNENEYYAISPDFPGDKAEILPEFEVNGKKYSKVLHLSSDNPPYWNIELYAAPQIGIIQKKEMDGTVYLLKSSNVKPR